MYLFRVLTIIFLACGIGFSAANPFSTSEWDAYRLKNPEQSRTIVKTARLEGVPVTAESFDDLFQGGDSIFSQDPVLTYWGGSRADTQENKERWRSFLKTAQNRSEANLLSWRGFYSNSEPKTFIGFVGAYRFQDTGGPYDGAIEMVCAFDSEQWRQGYATEAVVGYVHSDVTRLENYQYIFTTTHPENVGSIRLGQKLGLKEWPIDLLDPVVPKGFKRVNRKYWRLEKSAITALFSK